MTWHVSFLAVRANMRSTLGHDQAHYGCFAARAGQTFAAEDPQGMDVLSPVPRDRGKVGTAVAKAGPLVGDGAMLH